jgi:hypothetical protein
MRIRRVNIFGAPCSGKSSIAALVFHRLKKQGYDVEHSPEYIKWWTFIDRKPTGFDQIYLSATQIHQEDMILRRHKNAILVTDCPILLGCYYGLETKVPGMEDVISLAKTFEKIYPSINIVLDGEGIAFSDSARFHNKKQSQEIHKRMVSFLKKNVGDFFQIKTTSDEEHKDIVFYVTQKLRR